MIKKKASDFPVYFIIPLLLIVTIVPLIVHLKAVMLDDTTYQFWTGQKENADFFSYYKSIFIIALSSLSLLVFLFARYMNIIETKRMMLYYAPIFGYTVLILISTALSKYPITAQNGFADRYEGMYVLLAYVVILFTAINFVNSVKSINIILMGLFISAFILGTIGIFQYFGMDLFQSALGHELILPAAYKDMEMKFTFGADTIYSTLYNTNYVGSYMAILFPLSLAAFLYVKKPYLKVCTGILTCLMFANWVGCRSRAGYMGGTVAIILLVILMRKVIIKNIKIFIPLLLVFLMIFVGMDSFAGNVLSKRLLATVTNINDYSPSQSSGGPSVKLKDIALAGKKVSIVTNLNTLNMVLANNQVGFTNTKGEQLVLVNDPSGDIIFDDKDYKAYKVAFDSSSNLFGITLNNMKFNFFLNPNGFKIVGERNILLDKIDYPQSFGFKGMERFASSRGYIWSRSIPLLKNNLIVGGGPDTFVEQFPQHDYIGKLIAFDTVSQIVDKPHNMYLQMGINTGVLSLVSFLFLFLVYAISSIKLYFNGRIPDRTNCIGISIFCAVLGYMVAGLANDSLVSVAPVFWAILGIGVSCNDMIRKGVSMPVPDNKKTIVNEKLAAGAKKA